MLYLHDITMNVGKVKRQQGLSVKEFFRFGNRGDVFAISISMYLICSFQVRFSSRKTPRDFIGSVLFIWQLLMSNFDKTNEILSCLLALWKTEYFVFLTFKDILLEINY